MKKKVHFFVILAMLTVMPLVAGAQDKPCDSIQNLPWWEDFQAYPHNTTPPTEPFCWHFQGTNEPSVGQYNVHNGYMTCILDLYSTGVTWAVLQNPFAESLDINHLQVTFSAGKSSTSSSHNSDLIIGITTNPTNPSDANFVPLDTLLAIPYCSPDTMARFTVDFAAYNDTGRYFCFKSCPIMSSGVNFLAIDSLVFNFNDHCMVPQDLRVYHISDISASFNWNQYHSNHVEFEYKAVNDSNWTLVNVTGRYLTLSNVLLPETQYMARIRQDCSLAYNGYSDWSDTIYFTTEAEHCRRPEDVILSDISNTTATFTWTAAGSATSWEVHVFNSSYNRTFTANTNSYTVTGLSHGTNYRVSVRSMCDATSSSVWSDTLMVTTSNCFVVSNVNAAPTAHEAVITWSDNANVGADWEVIYGLPGFEEGQELGLLQVSGTPQATLTGLDANTNYQAKVRSLCTDNRYSEYTSVLFSTQEEQQQGVDEVEGLHLAVYPNPASTNTTISVSGVEGLVNVAIISLDGRTVQSYVKECPSDCPMVLVVENLAKGTYLVRVYNEKINVARKFSVQ
jgi:hypothetical protein